MYHHASIDLYVDPRFTGAASAPTRSGRSPVTSSTTSGTTASSSIRRRTTSPRSAATAGRIPAGRRTRQYERSADGSWHDGLLMELLAGDLAGSRVPPRTTFRRWMI